MSDKNTAPQTRRTLCLTPALKDAAHSDDYHMVVKIPDMRNFTFKHVSLVSASLPNAFYTIQGNDTNERFIVMIHYWNPQYEEKLEIPVVIPQGYYTKESLVTTLNTYTIKAINDAKFYVLNNDVFTFTDDTHTKLKFYLNLDKDTDKHPDIYDREPMRVHIIMPSLIYKIFGATSLNQNIESTKTIPDDNHKNHEYTILFENQMLFIWVNTIQVRLDIVDASEDSNVLIEVPIIHFEEEYIGFFNPQIEETAKTISSRVGTSITVTLTNQDGYEINFGNIGCNVVIQLF